MSETRGKVEVLPPEVRAIREQEAQMLAAHTGAPLGRFLSRWRKGDWLAYAEMLHAKAQAAEAFERSETAIDRLKPKNFKTILTGTRAKIYAETARNLAEQEEAEDAIQAGRDEREIADIERKTRKLKAQEALDRQINKGSKENRTRAERHEDDMTEFTRMQDAVFSVRDKAIESILKGRREEDATEDERIRIENIRDYAMRKLESLH